MTESVMHLRCTGRAVVEGRALYDARHAAGFSAREVAELVGQTSRAVERNEGRRIPLAKFDAYIAAMRAELTRRLTVLAAMEANQ